MNLRNLRLSSLYFGALTMLLPALSMAGMSPEEIKSFQINKAKAEAGEGLPAYVVAGGQGSPFGGGTTVDANGKPISYNDPSPSPAALLANAYLSGAGVEKNESEAFFWYEVVRGHGLLIPNEKAFLAMIRSMPAVKIDGVLRRLNARRDALSKAEYSRSKSLSDSKFKSLSQFDAYSFDHCVEGVVINRHVLRSAARIYKEDDLYPIYNWLYEANLGDGNPNFPYLLFPLGEEGKKISDELTAKGRRMIDRVIAGTALADSSDMKVVADAYAEGHFGLKVDEAQRRKWLIKAYEARLDEAHEMRKKADAGGPEEWLQIAGWARNAQYEDFKDVLGYRYMWLEKYEKTVGLKADLGDPESIDEMIQMLKYEKVGNSGGFKVSPDRNDLLKWISARHKISGLPSDAIMLAHAYAEEGDKCFSPEIKEVERSRLARSFADKYLKGLFNDAASGDLSAKLKLAVLSDPNLSVKKNNSNYVAVENFERVISSLSGAEYYTFAEDVRLLQKFNMTGRQILSTAEYRKSGERKVYDPNAKTMSTRELYLDFISSSDKQDSLMSQNDLAGLAPVLNYLAAQDEEIESSISEISDNKSPRTPISLKWYRRLAEMGDQTGLRILAESYDKGLGVAPDAVTAYAYHALAGTGPGVFQNVADVRDRLYLTTEGSNEKKLDAAFKLSPSDKELAFKKYKELLDGFSSRVTRIGESIAKANFEAEDKSMKEYQAAQAAKKSAEKK